MSETSRPGRLAMGAFGIGILLVVAFTIDLGGFRERLAFALLPRGPSEVRIHPSMVPNIPQSLPVFSLRKMSETRTDIERLLRDDVKLKPLSEEMTFPGKARSAP